VEAINMMMNRNRVKSIPLLLLLVVLITACGSKEPTTAAIKDEGQAAAAQASETTKPSEKITLRLRWLHQAQFAGFYTAVEKGFYADAGLEVDIQPGGPDFPAVQMVAAGGEQFGVTGPDQIILSREKGVPIVAVSAIYRKSPFVLFSSKQSGITKMEDLIGKNVGVKLSGSEELVYRAMMKSAGIDKTQVKESVVKFDLTPFLEDKVDVWPGFIINEVLAAQKAGKELNIIYPNDYGVNTYGDTLFTTEKMIKEKPEVVKAFVQASMKGWDYAINNPEEAAGFGLKYSDKLDSAHQLAMMNNSVDLLDAGNPPLGKMADKEWDNLQQLLLEMKFLKTPQKLTEIFTNDFIE
jgi:ABC-type nitrate/sulfonate/bicarbonate transport system substrate-binding protein